MSKLEKDVKPILVRLIEKPELLESLTPEERWTVARWTLKTAAVLNRTPVMEPQAMALVVAFRTSTWERLRRADYPPIALTVGAGYKSTKIGGFLQYAVWTNPKNSIPLEQKDLDCSYKIGLSLRDLVLIAAYYPSADYAYGINSHHYVPLWTGKRKIVPVDHLMDDSAAKSSSPQLEGLLRNISVISSTYLKLIENVAFTRLIV